MLCWESNHLETICESPYSGAVEAFLLFLDRRACEFLADERLVEIVLFIRLDFRVLYCFKNIYQLGFGRVGETILLRAVIKNDEVLLRDDLRGNLRKHGGADH